ncbi:hypothetical protein A2U01_0073954, partial [Trifolium medium]|nr:hypothetical protein [Trifolium medium]
VDMNLRGNCGDPWGCGWRKNTPQRGNEDGDEEHFRWWGKEW